jgi:hypothetical protein
VQREFVDSSIIIIGDSSILFCHISLLFCHNSYPLLLLLPFIFLAAALNPEALYTSKMERKPKFQHVVAMAIKKLSSSSSKASAAIDQYTFFRKQAGLFGGEEAKDSALNHRASAGKSCCPDLLWCCP